MFSTMDDSYMNAGSPRNLDFKSFLQSPSFSRAKVSPAAHPKLDIGVNPLPRGFIYRTLPLGDSARPLLKKPIKTKLSQHQGNYDTFRRKNLLGKINLLEKGLNQGIRIQSVEREAPLD